MDRDSNGDLHLKAINKTYFNLDDPNLPSSVQWDMADDSDNVVIPELVTMTDLGDKSDLINMVNKAIRDYEKSL